MALQCLKHNEVFKMPKRTGLDCLELFGILNQLFNDLDEHSISIRDLKEETETLLKENQHLGFVKVVQKYGLFSSDLIILLFFCHNYVNVDEDIIGYWSLKDLFSYSSDYCGVKRDLMAGEYILQEMKLIEFCCDDGIADVERYRLTDKAKEELLSELGLSNAKKKVADVLDSSKLPYKKLFFASTTQRHFDELSNFLKEDNFKQIQERMKAKGFRNGFACLFYGAPGTGKTESVYQLAKSTGRNIMVVDIPKLRSMWVGETEKNMKAVFDHYHDCVKKSELYPILLFNEADAIIGKRKSGAEGSVDKMENALLNIVLQEMERLDGIMIATTNLEENMDKAFERRFLYKIKFEKPSLEARTQIWHSMIPELKESDVQTLASRYDFSGGQIENIARHYAIDSILHDQSDNVLATLITHCDNERLESKNSGRIGF
jgi:KaiC/GvpD/RAD55 family RecA-like ATPase